MAGLEVRSRPHTRAESAPEGRDASRGERAQAQVEWPGQWIVMGWAPCSQMV